MNIADLKTTKGADRLRLALGLEEDQVRKIQLLVESMAGSHPHIEGTFVGKAKPGVSFYDFKNDRLGIGHRSSDVLAHEMGHAASLANASDFYKGLLRGSKKLTNISNKASVPLSALIYNMPKLTQEQKSKLLLGAGALSGLIVAPNLLEEANASLKAIHHSPTKFRTGVAMLPGIISHSINDMSAPATYLVADKLLRKSDD